VVDHPFTVAVGDGIAEQNEVRQLTVDRDDGCVSRRHQHEFRADVVAYELAQSLRFSSFRLDG
jgi:hypothetical protein